MTLAMNQEAIKDVYKEMEDQAKRLGIFESVNIHEPKSAPMALHCAIFVNYIGPCPGQSSLDNTTGLVIFNARIYKSFISKPEDEIDPSLTWAALALMDNFSNDFSLNGTVREVDLLGQSGTKLETRAGYVTIDNKIYRIMNVTIPIIINDLWTQAA